MPDPQTPATSYQTLRQEIQKVRSQRIQQHQQTIAGLKKQGLLAATQQNRPLVMLADGDSWFDYPLPIPVVNQSDIISQLPGVAAVKPVVLNMAHYGDATTTSMGVSMQQRIISQLKEPANGPFDAILFSGGGDDLVGDQFCLWLNQAAGCQNNTALAIDISRIGDIFGVIQGAYLDLVGLRNQYAPGIPIFTHSYDFAQPTGTAAPCGEGPWLKPSLDFQGWTNFNDAAGIVKALLIQFDAMLANLAAAPENKMVHVRTQGTLDPTADWANELHPTPPGFKKITQCFLASLQGVFPGRI
jgi:hypothetical protein